MPQTSITTQVHQTLDVHADVATQVTLDCKLCNLVTKGLDLAFGQVANSSV
jgi:hypothetical protein